MSTMHLLAIWSDWLTSETMKYLFYKGIFTKMKQGYVQKGSGQL